MNIKKIKTQLSEELRRETRIRMRIKVVTIAFGVVFLIVSGRAFELHCIKNSELEWVASKQYQAVIPQSSRRGSIFDRQGKELALSLPVPSIYADPKTAILNNDEKLHLAQALDMDIKDLNEKLKTPKRFAWLKRMVDNKVKEEVIDLTGIYSIEESKRFYPNGALAGHVLGAVGMASEPLAGMEMVNDKFLSSKRKSATYRRDARGKFYVSPIAYGEQDDVDDVYLTIDKKIQFATEHSLKKAVETANAKGGSAIVMDVTTGAILAMANMPMFDPNNYSQYGQDSWRNRAITDTIEPGSTFKTLIVASALELGAVKSDSVFDCESGAITIGKAVLHDSHSHAVLSVKDIIKISSNIGAYKIAKETGKEKIFDYLKKFGVGNKTGIDFPGEVGGSLKSAASWQPIEFATIAFGQGLSVTPIQMVSAFSAIANGGKLLKPYLIDHINNNQGITIMKTAPTVLSVPINEGTASTVMSMLEGVVGEGGTGTRAASKEYPVAGKTGTAQKVTEGSSKYATGKYYASFIGIAPSDKPRVAIFVGMDEPKGAYYGGTVSAPVFKDIAEATMKVLEVQSSVSRVVSNDRQIDSEEGIFKTENKRFQKVGKSDFSVPDVRGITIRDVMESIGQADIKVKVEGSGMAVQQEPTHGSIIREGETFKVSFRQPE